MIWIYWISFVLRGKNTPNKQANLKKKKKMSSEGKKKKVVARGRP